MDVIFISCHTIMQLIPILIMLSVLCIPFSFKYVTIQHQPLMLLCHITHALILMLLA